MANILPATALASAPPLPAPLTGFIGREQELAEVRRLADASRVLTLTGAGGSGKTRLALALAQALAAERRPVAWVELAPLADAGALATHVALSLGIRSEGAASPEQALIAHLGDADATLVLDNCEHVVDECARLIGALVASCPRLRVVATSREALGVGGERSWLVPPLAVPAAEEALDALAGRAAVRLFVERAQDASRTFALTADNAEAVARICRRLDGLPLAIELAAARVAVLTPAQIAARLDDRFTLLTSGARAATPRQRTLRGAMDWSYDLLDARERLLLERLAVFAGPFTLEAAEAVCGGGDVPADAVLETLAALATKSLVAMQEEGGHARYRLLETVREYAKERRRARGAADDDPVEARHAVYFLGLARAAEPALLMGRRAEMQAMDLAHDDLLAALAWSAERREGTRIGLPLVWALLWYWFHRQLWPEGFAQAERALATADDPPPALRAAALHGMGLFGMYARDPRTGERLAEAQRLWREAGEERWQAFTRLVETVAASLRKDVATATAYAEEMLAIAQRQRDPWDAALAKAHGLVPVLVWQGRWADASRLLDEALATYRAQSYDIGVAYALDSQAFVSLQLGDVPRAVRLTAQSLRHDPATENRWLAGRSLRVLGAVADQRGDPARALRLFGAADAMYEAIGAASLTAERQAVNSIPQRLRGTVPEAEFAAAWEAGRAMTYREAIAYALEEADREPPSAPDPAVPARAAAAAPAAPRAAPALEIRALGRLEILLDGRPLPPEAWPYAKPRELLLYLAAHPEGRTREQVGLDFWPEISAAQVKNNFHVTLHHLRRALGDGVAIRFERGRYRLEAAGGVEFDAARFEVDAAAALKRLRKDAGDAEAGRALAEALARHRGPFLEEEQAGDWHLELRDRLARLHDDAREALAAHHAARGDHAAAAEAYRAMLAADPLHEEAARGLMLALARGGDRSAAIKAYERFAQAHRRELRAEPAPAMRALAERIRTGTAS